jgi:DNA-binding transcriptional LysR family regulator
MNLRQLRSFVAVAEELSFTRAAARLHLAQPALSVQLRQLEDELGVVLIDRSRRAIALTEAGTLMLDHTRRLLTQLEQTVDLVRRAGSGAVGHLSIGFVPSAANDALPPLLRRFGATHPDVAIHLRELPPDALVRALHEGRLDVCFLYLPFEDPLLDQAVVAREAFVAAVPQEHELARSKRIDVEALRDERFILPARHSMPGLNAQVLDICREAGFTPLAIQDDVWLVQTMVGLVAAGVGVALVPASAEALQRRGVVYVPLEQQRRARHVELAAVWRRGDRSVVLSAFVCEAGRAPVGSGSVSTGPAPRLCASSPAPS